MKDCKYVVIEASPSRPLGTAHADARTPRAAKAASTQSASRAVERTRIEVGSMTPREARRMRESRAGATVAAAMPMKLVKPVSRARVRGSPSGTAWGVQAVGAETSTFTGAGITVAVLDTGIDAKHLAFKGLRMTRKNFSSETGDDIDGHGTHCAGTIFGRNMDGFRIGVAPGVKRALIGKVLGEGAGSSDVIARAIQWSADEGVQVIAMSLGIDFPGYVKEMQQAGLPVALATARALEEYRSNVLLFQALAGYLAQRSTLGEPVMLVAAAGNESLRDSDADFEIGVSPPAVAQGFVSVGALGQSPKGLVVAGFSNTGVMLCGPGVAVTSARAGGGLVSMSGTSQATPHAAGVAALWAQRMQAEGSWNTPLWLQRMVGAATTRALARGFDPSDVGAGVAMAPPPA